MKSALMPAKNDRATALNILLHILPGAKPPRSLSQLLHTTSGSTSTAVSAYAQTMIYGVCRYYLPLKALIEARLQKPLKAKDRDILIILLLGAFQILQTNKPDHAIVNATAELARKQRKTWAVGLVNGVLRQITRDKSDALIAAATEPLSAFPKWIAQKFQQTYTQDTLANLFCNSLIPAPMTLRYNPHWKNPAHFTQALHEAGLEGSWSERISHCFTLKQPTHVDKIPGFQEGSCSVQDEAAQLAAHLLNPLPDSSVLDACAAPGGKTCHLLELGSNLKLTAIDTSAIRLQRVQQNLDRLNLHATLIHADAMDLDTWWDKTPYDYILLDAPCSALGVLRRHPDIFWLKQEIDVAKLVKLQETLLDRLWSTLRPGGSLLYCTCSVLPEENEAQIDAFLQRHTDAKSVDLSTYRVRFAFVARQPTVESHGLQLLPQKGGVDGFYYALLRKTDFIESSSEQG